MIMKRRVCQFIVFCVGNMSGNVEDHTDILPFDSLASSIRLSSTICPCSSSAQYHHMWGNRWFSTTWFPTFKHKVRHLFSFGSCRQDCWKISPVYLRLKYRPIIFFQSEAFSLLLLCNQGCANHRIEADLRVSWSSRNFTGMVIWTWEAMQELIWANIEHIKLQISTSLDPLLTESNHSLLLDRIYQFVSITLNCGILNCHAMKTVTTNLAEQQIVSLHNPLQLDVIKQDAKKQQDSLLDVQ